MWWGRWDLNPGSPTPQAGILNQAIRRPPSEVRRPRGDVSVRALFSFPEEFSSIHLCDVFETSFYQLSCFFEGRCSFADVVIVLDCYELRIDERICDVSVSEQMHDVQNVFGLMVLHRGLPVPERMEVYL